MAFIDAAIMPAGLTRAGQGAIYGIRPEHLGLTQAGEGLMQAVITHCEYMGSETFLSFEIPGTSGLTVRLPGEVRRSVGEEAGLTFDPSNLHAFDKSTGYRLQR
jgi:ABC-type sugar transport system ATPase subunit